MTGPRQVAVRCSPHRLWPRTDRDYRSLLVGRWQAGSREPSSAGEQASPPGGPPGSACGCAGPARCPLGAWGSEARIRPTGRSTIEAPSPTAPRSVASPRARSARRSMRRGVIFPGLERIVHVIVRVFPHEGGGELLAGIRHLVAARQPGVTARGRVGVHAGRGRDVVGVEGQVLALVVGRQGEALGRRFVVRLGCGAREGARARAWGCMHASERQKQKPYAF
mmetsp:Transcript_20589/g.60812  ORF Transcript_20589/g.60812 Transcript_20589/m.60812 type:complete len:223 (+) Transcript_20589:83-751(+)